MKRMQKLTPFVFLAVLSGCAILPVGPSVNVLPAKGKSFDTFRAEDATCRQWAEQQLGKPVQETYEQDVATGAVAGTAVGAGLGAVVGSASGHAGVGAALGAATGLLAGTAIGSNAGQLSAREAQLRYDNAYVQCMYSYGNQVPGYRRAVAKPKPAVVAPPPPPEPAVSQAPEYSPPPAVVEPPPIEAQVSEDYPPPSEIYFDEAPQFIYSPPLNMYIAVGVPYDLVYTGNEYFYFHDGRWYRGPYYNGPWRFVPRRAYPPAFARYRINNIRHYREAEFRRYEHDRARYDGRFHRPEFRGERRRIVNREEHR